MSNRRPASLRSPIRRVGHLRHHPSPANHALALDFRAAGFSLRVSRVWTAWARRPSPVTTHAARRHRRHLDLPLAHLRGVRRRPVRTRYCGQLQHQHSGDRPHRAHCVPPARPVALQRKRIGRRSAGAAVLHHPSPLHAEHDGEQLHPAADAHRILISIRMAAHRQPPRSFHRLLGAGTEPADAPHHRIGPCRDGNLRLAGALVWRSGGDARLSTVKPAL